MATCGDGELAESSSSVCGICIGTVRDARLLPCLHSFCKSCLDDLNMRTGHDHKITCPICRSTSHLPENGASGLAKDITRTVEEVCECDTCKEDGGEGLPEVFCRTCHFGFCREHGIPHLLANPDHNLKPLGIKGCEKPSTTGSSAVRLCEEHDLPLRCYCQQCNTAVCGECVALGRHHGHKSIVAVEEIAKELRERVRHKTDNVKKKHLPRVQKSLSAVEKVSTQLSSRAEDVRTQIRLGGKYVTDTVQLLIQERLVEVDDVEEVRLKDLNGQHDDLKRHADSLKSVLRFGETILKSEDSTAEVCDLLLAIEMRVDQLEEVKIPEEPVQHARVDFESVTEEDVLARASKLVGVVMSRQASAAHSLVEGSTKEACSIGSTVCFTIAAKDNNGRGLVKGGDVIQVEYLQLPNGGRGRPSIEVFDKKNGTYEISCRPQDVGDYSFEVLINKAKLQQRLSISCQAFTFNPAECQQYTTINVDLFTVTHTGSDGVSSVLGNRGMKMGQHTWKVKVNRGHNMWIFLGVAEKPGITAKENNYRSTYSWHGYDGCKWTMGQVSQSMSIWQVNDVLQLDLDCDAHTLSITNTRSGEEASMHNLPAKEWFAYFCTFWKDDSLTLVL